MDLTVENNLTEVATGTSFEIIGGTKLSGSIEPQGAKNEALQVLCTVLLTNERVIIENVPEIRDVLKLIELLEKMGVVVERIKANVYSFEASNVNMDYLQTKEFSKLASALRGSIMIVGPLLARFGKASIPKPGGDKIGRRRLDTHFIGFQSLGAKFDFDGTENFFTVEAKELKGTYMHLDEASVT